MGEFETIFCRCEVRTGRREIAREGVGKGESDGRLEQVLGRNILEIMHPDSQVFKMGASRYEDGDKNIAAPWTVAILPGFCADTAKYLRKGETTKGRANECPAL